MRIYETLAGLSVGGQAAFGPMAVRVPGLLTSVPAGPSGSGPLGPRGLTLTEAPAEPGHRSVRISDGTGEVRLEFPIPTPEVSGATGTATEAAPGVWILHWPIDEDTWAQIRTSGVQAIGVANARALWSNGESFVRAVDEIRTRVGADPILWAPRVALPHRMAMLIYLGIDLLDTTEASIRSSEGEFLTAELGPLDATSARTERTCDCPSCTAGADPVDGGHAGWMLDRELRLARTAMRAGRLRELVEARLTAEPLLAEILRHADERLAGALESRSPVTGSEVRNYVLQESRRRPEVVRFRARFLTRYRPPPSKEVLLLVPCSQTKPYRSSPSHRRMLGALEGVANRPRLHVASVTSPLGIVPRELEDMPPARQYDIPVTHVWEEDERDAVRAALEHILGKGGYRSVLVHLDPSEYDFLIPALAGRDGVTWTVRDGRTTSSDSLRTLSEAARTALESLAPVKGGPLSVVREELAAIADLQFGSEAGRRLFEGAVRLHGRPWFQRLTDANGTDLATWREERGLFQLTMEGARRILPTHTLEVEARPDVPMRGDLFVPGIARADPGIRTGDAVLVVRDGSLLAVGEAAIPGGLMNELRRGLGVRLRHRLRSESELGRSPGA